MINYYRVNNIHEALVMKFDSKSISIEILIKLTLQRRQPRRNNEPNSQCTVAQTSQQ